MNTYLLILSSSYDMSYHLMSILFIHFILVLMLLGLDMMLERLVKIHE